MKHQWPVLLLLAVIFLLLTTATFAQENKNFLPLISSGDSLSESTPTATSTPTKTPISPTPFPENVSPFTGEVVDNSEWLKDRPIFVCINNDSVGRSAHRSLSQADMVYEYIIDGFSLTRMTAMFQSQAAESIGPVRSARLPNIWMTYMYDGVLACSGGSDAVRSMLKNDVGFPYLDADIDDPSLTRYFFSLGDDYRTRLHTSTQGVRNWLTDNNLNKDWQRPGFEFSNTPPANSAGTVTTVQIPYPGDNSVEWRYDPGQGGYTRFQGGQQQFDPATNQPIVAQNVVVLSARHELTDIVEDSLGTKGVDIELYGVGDLRVFRDGHVYEGRWEADHETPPRWIGSSEIVIPLKPGQSWMQVVQKITDITYH